VAFCAAALLTFLTAPTLRAQFGNDLIVGDFESDQTTNFTSGTHTYDNTYVGRGEPATNNTLGVYNAGTLLTLRIDEDAFESGGLYVGYQGSTGNRLVISNGGTLGAAGNGYIGFFSDDNTALVTGSGSLLTIGDPSDPFSDGGRFYVGDGNGNSLVISNGGKAAVSRSSSVGFFGSSNSVLVTGTNSLWTNGIQLNVGDMETSGNSLVISNGGRVAGIFGTLGRQNTASNNTAMVTGTDSLWTNSGKTTIGSDGSGNSLVISNGGRVQNNEGFIGENATALNNSVLVTGAASTWSNSGALRIAQLGSGTLTVASGGSVASSGITIASSNRATGTLNVGRFGTNDTGGTIIAPTIAFGAGTGLINFNQSDAVTITSVISGAGTLNQLGSGTTTLSGNNSYSGATTVGGGTLLVDGEISLSDVSVLNGAAIGGNGTLGGSLSLAAGAQFVFSLNGALTVNGSSVTFDDFGIDDLVGLDSTVANGAYTLIDGTAAINFSNVANLGAQNAVGIVGGKQAYFSEGSLVVNVIPEPSTYALLALALAALGAHVLLRRRSA
jgi:T5SS/PEP-CTERM-associated repeat protein/autotransporter-associated beta strand protein